MPTREFPFKPWAPEDVSGSGKLPDGDSVIIPEGGSMSESRTLKVQLVDGTVRSIPVDSIKWIYADAYGPGCGQNHPFGCTLIQLKDGTELETWVSCRALAEPLGTWGSPPDGVTKPVVEDAATPKVAGFDSKDNAFEAWWLRYTDVPAAVWVGSPPANDDKVSAFHGWQASKRLRVEPESEPAPPAEGTPTGADMFRELQAIALETYESAALADAVDILAGAFADQAVSAERAKQCLAVVKEFEAKRESRKCAAPAPESEPAAVDGDVLLHRCFIGSPFHRMLRAVRALQDGCLIPYHICTSPEQTPASLRNEVAKRLDAALGYCAMADLQHELYDVLREVRVELHQANDKYGSASWVKVLHRVSGAMTKIKESR